MRSLVLVLRNREREKKIKKKRNSLTQNFRRMLSLARVKRRNSIWLSRKSGLKRKSN